MTAPTLLGNFPMSMDKAATSDADPPIARVALSRKQKAVNIAVSEIKPQNLKQNKTNWKVTVRNLSK